MHNPIPPVIFSSDSYPANVKFIVMFRKVNKIPNDTDKDELITYKISFIYSSLFLKKKSIVLLSSSINYKEIGDVV